LELPIDHFRLLGVSPTTDGQTVLNMLQQRLERAPDQGFTRDTIEARADLLRASADVLSDDQRRQDYERELTSISAGGAIGGLEIHPSREVGGLLLLLEAGQGQEAFEAARRALQPPQAPSLGSGREADLTLLAGLACRAAAEEYQNQRRYETAARTLQQGLQQLQRMGKLPELRQELEQDLRQLQPYRVLDLIRRDLAATTERRLGIELLDDLVSRRGGLEGNHDPAFSRAEFVPFLQQIRAFLTAQEQVDLFGHWAEAGSEQAHILSAVAMTAAGFVQRKPERIQAALQRLLNRGHAGVEAVMACQLLLLGRVDEARPLFSGAGATTLLLRKTAQDEPPQNHDDGLADLCAACRRWLKEEVLPGFRDIEAEADLEAWFADRDVQAYIEHQDRIRNRQQPVPHPQQTVAEPPLPAVDGFGGDWSSDWSSSDPAAALPMAPDPAQDTATATPAEREEPPTRGPQPWDDWDLPGRFADGRRWLLELQAGQRTPLAVAAAIAVLALGGVAWLSLRPQQAKAPAALPATSRPQRPAASPRPAAAPPPAAAPAADSVPLTRGEPSNLDLQTLLDTWLETKASLLAGRPAAAPLAELASPTLIRKLEKRQAENRQAGLSETIEARVESLEILERGPNRISAAVRLQYSDETRDATGRVINRSPRTELRNRYVFIREGDTWRVADFRPGA
jgi:hypothetical protein